MSKISVIGCGKVGATLAYALALSGVTDKLILIDADKNKAKGEALDINHGIGAVNTNILAGEYQDLKDSDIIVVTAGVGRIFGESRFDLGSRNAKVIKEVAKQINKYYTGGGVLVVSNPVDVMTVYMSKLLGLPKGKVIGTGTTLDTARFRYEISKFFNVDKNSIYACVLGEHGDSNVPVWSLTSIDGIDIEEYSKELSIPFGKPEKENLIQNVKKAGTEIIGMKGATYYGISTGAVNLCRAILTDSHAVLPVTSPLEGEYGLNNTAISLLGLIGNCGLIKVLTPHLSKEEHDGIVASSMHIKNEIEKLIG